MFARPRLIAAVAILGLAATAAIAIMPGQACLSGNAALVALTRVTGPTLAVVSSVAIALLFACVAVIARDVMSDGAASWRPAVLWLIILFLIVFSAKLFLIRDNPATVPFWDQWDAEARRLFVPFNACDLSWSQMFSFHNEHRIFFTRLLALDLLNLNGVWDPRIEQVVNAAMHASVGVLLATMLWLANARRRMELIALVCAFTFAMPFAWENTLMGFQSAFYFLLLFSIPAIGLVGRHRPGSTSWFLGWACALSALVTSAGGMTAAVAIAGMVVLKLAGDWREWREALSNLMAAAVVTGLGLALASPPLPGHEPLRAKTAGEFFGALSHNLAWPWTDAPQLAAVMWLPVCLLLVAAAWRRGRTTELERLAVALGAWVAMNAAAIAYGRGAGGGYPATRYMDFLSIGLIANTLALVAVVNWTGTNLMARRAAWAALGVWLVFEVAGTDRLTSRAIVDLGVWRQYYAAQSANVRQFVITDDLAGFAAKHPPDEIPYPDPQSLAATLRDPFIRRILPSAVREPLHLEANGPGSNAFVVDGSPVRAPHDPLNPVWGSYGDRGRATEGRFDSRSLPGCRAGQLLTFTVSGYLGQPNHYLALKELVSGRDVPVVPAKVPREEWTAVAVPCPEHTFAVVAIDAEPESWFAFREPVVTGRLSLQGERLIAWSRELFFAALAFAALALRRAEP